MTKSGQPPKSFTTDTRVVRKNVAPASRRHLSLDNSFWVNTTFAGWKPAIHFFLTTTENTEMHEPSVSLRALCGREKKFEIRGFHARKLLKTLGAFLQFPIFSHDLRLRGEILSLRLCRAVQF